MEVLRNTLPPLLEAQGARVVGNLAARGADTEAFLEEGFFKTAAQSEATLAIVVLGGNNRTLDRADYQRQLERALRDIGLPTVWVGPSAVEPGKRPAIARFHEQTVELQKAIFEGPLRSRVVQWIDSLPLTQTGFAPDGVHFRRSGYERWAEGIVRALQRPKTQWGTVVGLGMLGIAGALIWRTIRTRPRALSAAWPRHGKPRRP